MAKTDYKPVIYTELCEYCQGEMPVKKYYEQKRFCTAKCRSLAIPMPPRPDQTGSTPWNKGLNKAIDERIAKMSQDRAGAKNWQWAGGVSRAHKQGYRTAEYKIWRKAVFDRDSYTCTSCKVIGGNLVADHIKCFAHHKEERFNIDNGRTLCLDCHKNTRNFGYHKREDCIGL